jgi:hypothetical protein
MMADNNNSNPLLDRSTLQSIRVDTKPPRPEVLDWLAER